MKQECWLDLMREWRIDGNLDTYKTLTSSYSQKHRHYHNFQHIDACLKHANNYSAHMEHPWEVELALWFHDAIYEPLSAKNELKSAEWAASFLASNGADSDSISRVYNLIITTIHNSPPKTKDESWLIDIDLSILGCDLETYYVFERAIRKEYRMIPLFLYKRKRAAVLQGFLDRDFIYTNEPFRLSLEPIARTNLIRTITKLTGKC